MDKLKEYWAKAKEAIAAIPSWAFLVAAFIFGFIVGRL